MKKVYGIINLVLICLVLVLDALYATVGGLWLKGLTSLGFVLIGAINLFMIIKCGALERKFGIIILIGLVFAMLGDIVLNVFFEGGAVLFAIGHIFYMIAYCQLIPFKWTDLIASATIFIPSVLFITLAPMFDFGGLFMEMICIIYALIISIMVGKSITNLIKECNLVNLIITIGSVLFFFSDLMLLLNVFGGLPHIIDILCIATYYPAQCLLAGSLYLIGIKYTN
jgi:hypothetical protein